MKRRLGGTFGGCLIGTMAGSKRQLRTIWIRVVPTNAPREFVVERTSQRNRCKLREKFNNLFGPIARH